MLLQTKITEDTFIDTYLPHTDEDGNYYRNYDWADEADTSAIHQAMQDNTLWTMVDGDDSPAILSGKQLVNRLFYIITDKPIPTDTEFEVELED
jgi:hypothetical protein